MAKPLVYELLNKRQRAAYPVVKRAVREGVSQSEIERRLKTRDLGIRSSVMRSMVLAEKRLLAYSQALHLLKPSEKPRMSMLPDALTRQTRKYAFTFDVEGVIIKTGQAITHAITLSLDTLLTRGQMEEMAADIVGNRRDRYGTEVTSSTITGGTRAGEEGTL